jgi:hypothetical protein
MSFEVNRQKLVLLSNVSVGGPGDAMIWNGGPFFIWSTATPAAAYQADIQVSFDGGNNWAGSAASLNANAHHSVAGGVDLPPCQVRGHVPTGTGLNAPNNLTLVMEGYDRGATVPTMIL